MNTHHGVITNSPLIEKAKQFAHEAHDSIDHKRKYTGEPYWTHLDAVAESVKEHYGDEETICAAYLHDVLEDVAPLRADFEIVLGGLEDLDKIKKIVSIVREVTDVFKSEDFPKLGRCERKNFERCRFQTLSDSAKLIKLCDMLDNTKYMAAANESDYNFAKKYLTEKLSVTRDFEMWAIQANQEDLWNKVMKQIAASALKL